MEKLLPVSILVWLGLSLAACSDRIPIQHASRAQCRALSPVSPVIYRHALAGVPARYQLERLDWGTSSPRYRATLNVRFFSPYEPSLAAHMRERTRGCLNAIAPKLIGPRGEKLEILLGADRSQPSSGDVEVTSELVRGHSQLWQKDWNCAQIVHEIFHLLGLADEYVERATARYDCRVPGPSDSIMASPAQSYRAVSPIGRMVQCRCPVDASADCLANLDAAFSAKELPKACPVGSEEIVVGDAVRADALLDQGTALVFGSTIETEPRFLKEGKHRFVREIPPERESILFPAQFETIVFPDCESSEIYQRCALDAYRTSGEVGCLPNRPAECSEGSLDWMKIKDPASPGNRAR